MATTQHWTITGAEGETIYGSSDVPDAPPRNVLIIAHGFKGYKDYGLFPRLGGYLARAGTLVHRFNFSHSGMTHNVDTFERPDLFEKDTWNKQVTDLRTVIEAVSGGDLAGEGLPYALFGHSRGGVTVLLTAGRYADDPSFPQPLGVITAAAPDRCNTLSKEEQAELLEAGYIESPSNRTGQTLRVDEAFLREQHEEPEAHDLLSLVGRLRVPIHVIHGEEDPTVPVTCAERLAEAAGELGRMDVIDGADHVFNAPNPMPPDEVPGPQLQRLMDLTLNTVDHWTRVAGRTRSVR